MRPEENEGHLGKQSDGFSKTRELKLVTLWAAESLDAQGWPTRNRGAVTYSAATESEPPEPPIPSCWSSPSGGLRSRGSGL